MIFLSLFILKDFPRSWYKHQGPFSVTSFCFPYCCQVDLLKQGLPDPSMMPSAMSHPQGPIQAQEKEERENFQERSVEFMADLVFIHSKLVFPYFIYLVLSLDCVSY